MPATQGFEFKLWIRTRASSSARCWELPLVGNRVVRSDALLNARCVEIDCGTFGSDSLLTSVRVTLPPLLTAAQIARFHADGFVVLERVLSNSLVDSLRRECAQSVASSVHLFANGCIVQSPHAQSDGVWRRDPTLRHLYLDVARALLGEHTVFLFNEQFIVKLPHQPPAATEFAYHRDQQYVEAADPSATFTPYVSLWTALTDMSEENGTLVVLPYVPGGAAATAAAIAAAAAAASAAAAAADEADSADTSDASEIDVDTVTKRARIAPGARFERLHRDAAARYGSDEPPCDDSSEGGELDERERAMLVKAGDVVAMSSLIWHRSNANISNQTRMAFMPQFTSMPVMMRDGAMLGIECSSSCDNAINTIAAEQLLDARE